MMWLVSPRWDLCFMVGPAFGAAALAALWPASLTLSTGAWLLLVVGVDVAHTWSSLYRTALDPSAPRRPLIECALAALVGASLLWALAAERFWSALAALAIFHFIRQQTGILALYQARAGGLSPFERAVERRLSEALCALPLVYWMTHLPRAFTWFTEGDLPALPEWVLWPAGALTAALALTHIGLRLRSRRLAWGRDLWLLGTGLSWFTAIVWTNSDGAFTIANVLPHGLSYMALVHRVGSREWALGRGPLRAWVYRLWPLWLLLPVSLALVEEGLWDLLVWQERWAALAGALGEPLLSLTPLLAVPQVTHYLLDARIWKMPPGSPLRRSLDLPC